MYYRKWLLLMLLFSGAGPGAHAAGEYMAQMVRFNIIKTDSIWQFYLQPADHIEVLDQNAVYWQPVDAQNLKDISGKDLNWPGWGWFRKTVFIPDSLRGKSIAIQMGHWGASEIYMDGVKIQQYGVVGSSSIKESPDNPQLPFIVQTDSAASHVFVVHYSNFQFNEPDIRVLDFGGFRMFFAPTSLVFESISQPSNHDLISWCIILSFCVFFFLVYLFYPGRIASLVSTLNLFNFSLIFFSGVMISFWHTSFFVEKSHLLWKFAFASYHAWNVIFVYSIYYSKIPRRTWFVFLLLAVMTLLLLFPEAWNKSILIFIVLTNLELWRMIILGLRNRQNGFLIIAIGYFLSSVFVLTAVFDVFHFFKGEDTPLRAALLLITDLFIPLTQALHLAWEFGSANRDLKRRLVEVYELSQKNLQQEKERQQMLEEQNIRLEEQVVSRTKEVTSQKKEIEEQRDKVVATLDELKRTQTQLVQREKMASLGELTAGIAHEIQNPLNFVNNFSDVNTELLQELTVDLQGGNIAEAIALTGDIEKNEQKINFHGKRADSIVKGMLEHSRTQAGQKEATYLNSMVEKYMRLSYHGIIAKNKNFQCALHTDFDAGIGKVTLAEGDIGRVMLNLFNNAFYSVAEKSAGTLMGYEPAVWVQTRSGIDWVKIIIKDNGTGIPSRVVDKIFQPFFTTKPTGEGTGLGLSISYDIIVKGHFGDLTVETVEGEYAQFIIRLPLG